MSEAPISWPAVAVGVYIFVRWLFREPVPEPAGETGYPDVLMADHAPNPAGLAYRGRLVERPPGSGVYRVEV